MSQYANKHKKQAVEFNGTIHLDQQYDEAAVCKIESCHRATLWRAIRRGSFPSPQKVLNGSNRWVGRVLLDYHRDPEAWAEANMKVSA